MRLTEAETALRERLRSTIEQHGKVEAKLKSARQALDHVRTLLQDLAQAEVDAAKFESLKAEIAAIRRPAVPGARTREANAAQTALEEVRDYHAVVERELATAQEEAIRAASAVKDAVDAVVRMEFEKIAMELMRAHQEAWHLLDLVNGYAQIDKRCPGGPTLREFQERICAQLNRRTAAIASGRPELREEHKWNAFLDERSNEAERFWTDFAARLATDPYAATPRSA
jgi:hypothetical protein